MRKKIALALTGLLLITAASFAPVGVAQWPPCVESYTYVIMGGQIDLTVALEYGPLIFVLNALSRTRDPYLKPYQCTQEMCFSPEIDPDGIGPLPPCLVMVNVTAGCPVQHVIYSPEVGGVVGMPWLKITIMPLPGFGWIYTVPNIADVDVLTFNNDSGTFWLDGTFAWNPQAAIPFPSPGADTLPGFCPLGPGTQDDGFGDGVPDPKGSSIIYQPEIFQVEGYNATTASWELLMGAPLIKVWTTAVAYDHVRQAGSALYCMDSQKEGRPWEFLATCLPWENASSKKTVTYASAGSVTDFVLDPGPPVRIALDVLFDQEEKKVRADCAIPDITCDMKVDIQDIVLCALAFGSHDEGLGPDGIPNTADDWQSASPNFDARAELTCDGKVNIVDLVKIAVDFGCEITPTCVVCP